MKILIVNTLFPPHRIGGAEKSVALLAEGLARAGDDVAVATLDDATEASFEALPSGVRVHRLPLDNIYWPYGGPDDTHTAAQRLMWHARNSWNGRAARRLGAILDREQPDIVHCNVLTGFSPAVWRAVKRRGLPMVQTLRDYGLMCARSALFKNGHQCATRCIDCRLLTLPAKQRSALVDQLVSNSDYVIRAHVEQGYFRGVPARRIFNVVDLPESARVAASAAGDPLVFGFIGRIESEKGIEVVLAACDQLADRDWRLQIGGVGNRDYVDALKARHSDPRIAWLGRVEADAFYRSIDVALIASVWPEPLPRTLIESIGHGVGAICADAGGIPEIAALAQPSVVYPATDATALATAMRGAIDRPEPWRASLSPPPERLSPFTEGAVVAQYRQAYADAIAVAGAAKR